MWPPTQKPYDQWKLKEFQKLSISTLNLPANQDCDGYEWYDEERLTKFVFCSSKYSFLRMLMYGCKNARETMLRYLF